MYLRRSGSGRLAQPALALTLLLALWLVASASTGAAPSRGPTAGASEIIQRGNFRIGLDAKLTPSKLPRTGAAPVRFSFSANIASTEGEVPPQLRAIKVEINRHGHFEPAGLPVCTSRDIQPSNNAGALEACRDALVGQGHFSAKVLITQQAPFPSDGKVLAFNGRWHGHPAILAHIYGSKPVPTSYTLPFVLDPISKGTYGTSLSASLPHFTSKWGYVTGISLDIGRSFRSGGHRRSYLAAACPAPRGFPTAPYSIARASLGFSGRTVHSVLTRTCKVRP
jgi:hypothetical protein